MFQYSVKRILIMIPTFFVVSVVIFMVLNLAPGKPGQANQGEGGAPTDQEQGNVRESYRIFKEQFNLDKPVFVNTRYGIEREEVESLIETVINYGRRDLAEGERPKVSDVVKAQDDLEDLGSYIVPHLYVVAKEHTDKDCRWYATQRLSSNSKRKLINEFSTQRQSPETRALNKEIDRENKKIAEWTYKRDASDAERAAVMARWDAWYADTKSRYEYSGSDKVRIFFTDTRFAKYWHNLLRLDLGVSHIDRKPVLGKILERLKYSLTLSFCTVLLVYLLAVPLGVFSAVRQGSFADQVLTVILFMLYSLPSFFTGVLLLQLLAIGPEFTLWPAQVPDVSTSGTSIARGVVLVVTLSLGAWMALGALKREEERKPWRLLQKGLVLCVGYVATSLLVQLVLFGSVDLFPAGSFESADADKHTVLERLIDIGHHLVLPVFCMTYTGLASLSRYARSGVLDVIRADYIRTARAKGLGEPMVIVKHAMRNGMIPILTLLGTLLPALIGGSVIIEIIFSIHGMGLLLFEAITAKDYNIVMGVLLISSGLTLVGLLLSDISYALVDPRISFD